MGAFLDKPKTEKHSSKSEGNGLRYGLSSMQGWRVEMEDAHCAMTGLPNFKDWSFFAVFDGHAGANVSAHCSAQLLNTITANTDLNDDKLSQDTIMKGIKNGFLKLDEQIRNRPEIQSGEDKSGSTAICALISPKHIFFANCGDSRAVMSRASKLHFFTEDHKPMNPLEKERIQNAGGSVMIQRVNGSLAVSRALGDFDYKNVKGKGQCEQLVSPEPEICELQRTSDDEFVVLACDGIYDVMSNEELCDFVRDRMKVTDDLEELCNEVIDLCLHKGSRDNMSVVIVAFEGAPKVCEEAIKKDKELDRRLAEKIAEKLKNDDHHDFCNLLQSVMSQISSDFPAEDFPPGGGIHSKQATIEKILHRLSPGSVTMDSD